MRNSLMKALDALAAADKNVMLLTADLGYGVFEEFESKFPEQFLNVGVAEQNMIGVATGLALSGKIVFVYSIGNFPTLRCLEQIRNDACYHELNINIIAMGGGFSYGALGMSHHATEDLGIMRSLPNVTIVAPCTPYEAEQATHKLAHTAGVGYLRIDKSKAELDCESVDFEIGKPRTLIEGDENVILVTGGIAEEAIKASEELKSKGISLKVVSVPTIKPLDAGLILSEINGKRNVITLEEANVLTGLGSEVANICVRHSVYPGKLQMLGINDEYVATVGSQSYLRELVGISARNIVDILSS